MCALEKSTSAAAQGLGGTGRLGTETSKDACCGKQMSKTKLLL